MDYYKEDMDMRRYTPLPPPPPPPLPLPLHDERDLYDRHNRYDYEEYHGSFPPVPVPVPHMDDALYRMPPHPLLPHPRDPLRDPMSMRDPAMSMRDPAMSMRDPMQDPIHEIPPPPYVYKEPVPEGAVTLGSVVLYPANPLEKKPCRRARPKVSKTVFVGSLPDNCIEKHLTELFTNCGKIVEVRVSRGRNFGHVQFEAESSVDRAMELSGCKIRIENSSLPKDCSRIHIDYAQDKSEIELRKRMVDNDTIAYTTSNASSISSDLHKEGAFVYAARHVSNWLGNGECKSQYSGNFFDMLTNVNSHGRKVSKFIQNKEEDELEFRVKKQEYFQKLEEECKLILQVYENATGARSRNVFTKAQRKSIGQWRDQALDIQERIRLKLEHCNDSGDGVTITSGPPSKKSKVEPSEEVEADLERAKREIEQLKVDRDVAVEKKDKQILQLKTLMAKFKKSSPEEWEKALGVEKAESTSSSAMDEEEDEMEVIDGVCLDDLNTAMEKEEATNNSLASAAAAYASMRQKVGSSGGVTGEGLSEAEVAIVAVMAAFLTVHPLGATMDAITAYFQTFNSAYNTYFLESLLQRLGKVFQRSGEGEGKWWFLGFQTCYATPSSTEGDDTTAQEKTP